MVLRMAATSSTSSKSLRICASSAPAQSIGAGRFGSKGTASVGVSIESWKSADKTTLDRTGARQHAASASKLVRHLSRNMERCDHFLRPSRISIPLTLFNPARLLAKNWRQYLFGVDADGAKTSFPDEEGGIPVGPTLRLTSGDGNAALHDSLRPGGAFWKTVDDVVKLIK